MKTLASLAILSLLLSGCTGPRKWVGSGFDTLVVAVDWSDGVLTVANHNDRTLHNVRLDIGTKFDYDEFWYRDKVRVGTWEHNDDVKAELYSNEQPRKLVITGWCDEGRLKGVWTASR